MPADLGHGRRHRRRDVAAGDRHSGHWQYSEVLLEKFCNCNYVSATTVHGVLMNSVDNECRLRDADTLESQ